MKYISIVHLFGIVDVSYVVQECMLTNIKKFRDLSCENNFRTHKKGVSFDERRRLDYNTIIFLLEWPGELHVISVNNASRINMKSFFRHLDF